METPLMLKISVANPNLPKRVDNVYKAIEDDLEGAECYRLDRNKVTGAAIEFVVILQSAAAVATIANLLYQVWKNHRDNGELRIIVDSERGIQTVYSGHTSEIEIEEFQRKINKAHISGQLTQMDREILEDIKRKRIWIKTK